MEETISEDNVSFKSCVGESSHSEASVEKLNGVEWVKGAASDNLETFETDSEIDFQAEERDSWFFCILGWCCAVFNW